MRIKKILTDGTTTTTRCIYSGANVIAEYLDGSTDPKREYVYAGGQLVATHEFDDGKARFVTSYHHSDHLSIRMTTDEAGVVADEQGHYPFGETWYGGNSKWQFTTYERDVESDLDYAMARYHDFETGRFSSVDPVSGSSGTPQSLNRYIYVQNDPVNLVDPLGLFPYGTVGTQALQVVNVVREVVVGTREPPNDLAVIDTRQFMWELQLLAWTAGRLPVWDVPLGSLLLGGAVAQTAPPPQPVKQSCPLGLDFTAMLAVGLNDANTANYLGQKALWEARSTGLPGGGDGEQAAYRHCYWTCTMTQEIGPDQAEEVGGVYERCGPNPNTQAKIDMDHYNNRIGVMGSSGSPCSLVCMNALKGGLLQTAP